EIVAVVRVRDEFPGWREDTDPVAPALAVLPNVVVLAARPRVQDQALRIRLRLAVAQCFVEFPIIRIVGRSLFEILLARVIRVPEVGGPELPEERLDAVH